jgi:hypothetical protein
MSFDQSYWTELWLKNGYDFYLKYWESVATDRCTDPAWLSYFATEGEDSMAHSIAEKAAELITWDEVESEVIDALKERAIKKQSEAIVQVLDKIESLERDYKKIDRADIIIKDADDKTTSEGYSPARIKERKELRQKIEKLENAVKKAETKGDYQDVYNLAGGGGNKPDDSQNKGKSEGEAS